MSAAAPQPPAAVICDLVADRRGVRIARGEWSVDQDRLARLPEVPKDFASVRASYKAVSTHAQRLNDIQIRSGFVDFLYSPRPVPPDPEKGK